MRARAPILLILSLAAASGVRAQTLATVGQSKITVEEFKRRLGEIKGKVVAPPSNEEFLEDLIRFKMGLLEADRLKLAQDPVVKERFEQVLYNALLEKELGPPVEKISPTEKDLKEFYKSNPELHLAHILIDVKPDATPEEREIARKRAEANLDEIRKSKRPFEELVKLYSDDAPTKESGGDLGYQTRATLLPDIYDIAVKMKDGEIRGLIETRSGYHILKLIDRRGYDLADKRQIRTALIDKKRQALFDDYFGKLKRQPAYKVDINKEALKSLR